MRLPLCVARAAKTQQARTGSHNSGPTTNPRGSRVTDHVGPRHVVGPVLPPRHHGVGDTAFLLTRDLLRQARLHWRAGDEVQIWGSSGLLQTLLRHELVDCFRLMTFPLVLGSGRRSFNDGPPGNDAALPTSPLPISARRHRHHEPAGPPHNGQM